jgi:hypothetical protein
MKLIHCIIKMLQFLIDNIFVMFDGHVFSKDSRHSNGNHNSSGISYQLRDIYSISREMSKAGSQNRIVHGTRQVPLVEKELLTLPKHPSSRPVFSGVRVTRSLVLCVCFVDCCLSFCTFSFGHCVVPSIPGPGLVVVIMRYI